jgi:hypothetical protein
VLISNVPRHGTAAFQLFDREVSPHVQLFSFFFIKMVTVGSAQIKVEKLGWDEDLNFVCEASSRVTNDVCAFGATGYFCHPNYLSRSFKLGKVYILLGGLWWRSG